MATKKTSTKVLETAVTARSLGFEIKNPETITKEDVKNATSIKKDKNYLDDNLFPIEEAIALIRKHREKDSKESIEPTLCYFEGSSAGGHKKHRKKTDEEIINLHILGVSAGIAEAMIIKTVSTILLENGVKEICVRLNNIGNKESQIAYEKEATAYYRKNINELNSNCRQLFKEGIHSLITKGKNQCVLVHEEAPKPMEFLDEDSRKIFSETLEYMETLDIPYEIDQTVLGDKNYSSNTVFEITDPDYKKIYGAGTRYNILAKKLGLKKDVSAIGVSFKVSKPKKSTEKALRNINESNVFFMQIGYEAKLKSLMIIDELRKSGIPTRHKLYRDRLSTQISSARKSNAGFFTILGQKEALEDTIIIRDRDSKNQYVVKRSEASSFLKKLMK